MSDKNAEPHSVAQAWAEASGTARPAPKKSKKKPHKKAMKPDVRRYVSVLVVLVVLLAVCFVGFIVAGFAQNVYITWIVTLALLLGTLFVIRSLERKKA